MRHHNPTSTSRWQLHYGKKVYKPYDKQYVDSYKNNGFKYATSKKRYVKVLQYIADHDGCKRVDVIRDVYGYKNVDRKDSWYKNMRICRGQGSSVFSQLLYIDVIDYDKKFCYHITERGREVLKTAYINDCAKIVKESKMNKKYYDTGVYVVYHRSANEDENMPCFFKTKNWKDKCTWSVADAFKTHDTLEAMKVANELNAAAKNLGHCLAGHIKFGRISVQEIGSMPL